MSPKEAITRIVAVLPTLGLVSISYWGFSIFNRLNQTQVSLPNTVTFLQTAAIVVSAGYAVAVFPPVKRGIERWTDRSIPFWAVVMVSLVLAGLTIYVNLHAVAEAAAIYAASQ